MRRSILGGIAALALVGATPTAAPAAPVSKTCSSAFTHAVIGGAQKCLHAGEFCAVAYKRQYPRYGFHCVAGRLR